MQEEGTSDDSESEDIFKMAEEEIAVLGIDRDLQEAEAAEPSRDSAEALAAERAELEVRRKRVRAEQAEDRPASSVFVSSDESINDMYVLLRELGKGSFARVMLAQKKTTFEYVAVKIVDKTAVPKSAFLLAQLNEELRVLKGLAHPQTVIRVLEVIEAPSHLYVVMEPCFGGDLLAHLQGQQGQHLSESGARTVLRQVADAVGYLHGRGIVHRDIKLENVLLVDQGSLARLKLTDFSVAKLVGTDPGLASFWMSSFCGTPSWMAPEIYLRAQHEGHTDRGYNLEVDLWSLGVLLFVLLSGTMPFAEGQFRQLMDGDFHFKGDVWRSVSDEAKQLIRQLLVVDPARRLTIAALLRHPWLLDPASSSSSAASSSLAVEEEPVAGKIVQQKKHGRRSAKGRRRARECVLVNGCCGCPEPKTLSSVNSESEEDFLQEDEDEDEGQPGKQARTN